jgi:hypothetical protein
MKDDAKQTMRELTTQIFALPFRDYLESGDFSLFCGEHGLSDVWREYLRVSRDRPDLYGDAVLKNAFTLFLSHDYHSRGEDFLHLFVQLMADFARNLSCPLPVDDFKRSLLLLGYAEGEVDHALFILRLRQEAVPPADECCPGSRTVILR